MTPKPPSSSDGSSLPPRHRPNMGNLAKDTTEMDLWAFDDMDPQDEMPVVEVQKPSKQGIPVPRDSASPAADSAKETVLPEKNSPRQEAEGADKVTVNINRKGRKVGTGKTGVDIGSLSGKSHPGEDFDDLESWDDAEPVAATAEPVARTAEPVPEKVPAKAPAPVAIEPMPVEGAASVSSAVTDERDEFSTDFAPGTAAPFSPKLNLTKVERVGLAALLVVILVVGGVFYLNTISRLPTGDARVRANDFPIQGGKISVTAAVTFWRAPITSGDKADTVRRDALLIPVVDLATSGGPAAIRVFFRNSERELIGDAVSRTVRGDMKFQIAATDGFQDMGTHAAYRTGQEKPWTIEVFEAPSEDSPVNAFKKLFEMNIASDRR